MAAKEIIMMFLESAGVQTRERSKEHIVNWPRNTTRIPMPEMHRRKRSSRKQRKPIMC